MSPCFGALAGFGTYRSTGLVGVALPMMAPPDCETTVQDSSWALGLDFALSGRGGRACELLVPAPR